MCQSVLSRITDRRCRLPINSSSGVSSNPSPPGQIDLVFTVIPIMKSSGLMAGTFFCRFSGISHRWFHAYFRQSGAGASLEPKTSHYRTDDLFHPGVLRWKGTATKFPSRSSFLVSFRDASALADQRERYRDVRFPVEGD